MRIVKCALLLALCTPAAIAQKPQSSPSAPRQLCHVTVAATHTGDTAETKLATCAIPAGTLSANSRVDVHTVWNSLNGNAANCTVTLRFGTANSTSDAYVASDASAGAGVWEVHNWHFSNRNSTSAQVYDGLMFRNGSFGAAGSGSTAYASASSALYINATVTDGNTTDTCTVQEMDVTLWP